jgi:hypothetical protein
LFTDYHLNTITTINCSSERAVISERLMAILLPKYLIFNEIKKSKTCREELMTLTALHAPLSPYNEDSRNQKLG